MVYRSYQRGDGVFVALERDPGVAVMAPAWVLDAAICGAMHAGPPRVSCGVLSALSALLVSQGFRRSFGDCDSPPEAEHGSQEDNSHKSSGTIATPVSGVNDLDDEPSGEGNGDTGSCAPVSGSGQRDHGGDL